MRFSLLREVATVRMSPVWLVQVRGNKKQTKQKSKKDIQKKFMKDFVKKMEMKKLMLSAILKAAKMGEPFDPEMLNPARKRPAVPVSHEEGERRYLLVKEWSRYRMQQHKEELSILHSMVASRNRALKELNKVSPSLVSKALELNPKLFPLECIGPMATPPIAEYTPPDPET